HAAIIEEIPYSTMIISDFSNSRFFESIRATPGYSRPLLSDSGSYTVDLPAVAYTFHPKKDVGFQDGPNVSSHTSANPLKPIHVSVLPVEIPIALRLIAHPTYFAVPMQPMPTIDVAPTYQMLPRQPFCYLDAMLLPRQSNKARHF